MSANESSLLGVVKEEPITSIAPDYEAKGFSHALCQNCTDFCENWDVLDYVQLHGEKEKKEDKSWPPTKICTVAHLRNHKDRCHLCDLLLQSLNPYRTPNFKDIIDMDVYLDARIVNSWEPVHVAVRLVRDIFAERDEPESKYNHLGSFSLGLYDSSKGDGFLQHVFERNVPLTKDENIRKAKSWIESCVAHHARCQDFHEKTVDCQQRPSRVLDVSGNTIRLRCDLGNEPFDYLTLSHMWGDDHYRQLKLYKRNLASFELEVPREELEASETFKDAVQVTLALGYRYLWIDSLCIIQDSTEDWKFQASRMAMIYGNSVCNLAYVFPAQGRMEPKSREDLKIWSPCVLRAQTNTVPGVFTERGTWSWRLFFDMAEAPNSRLRYPWLLQRDWPLFKRAWTFQEYLLSPRTLILGHQNLMWHCSELFYDELLGSIAPHHGTSVEENPKHAKDLNKSRYFPETLTTVATSTCLTTPSILSFMKDWQNVINEYRARSLTYSTDRIIAFGGIARSFQNFASLTYLAGTWIEIFPLCLLWYVNKKTFAEVRLEYGLQQGPIPDEFWRADKAEELKCKAPSWSWFSVPIYRMYQLSWLFDIEDVYVRSKGYLDPPMIHWDEIFSAEIDSFQFDKKELNQFPESNSFFEFKDLQVSLDMPVLPIKADWLVDIAHRMVEIGAESTSEEDANFRWEHEFNYFPDVPAGRKSPPKNAIYALVLEYQTVRVAGNHNIKRHLAGLMLIPKPQSNCWVRVGIWQLKIKISEIPVSAANMAVVAQRWREYDIISSNWSMETITLM